jgi:mRNA-degrading endonuclease RelE of RelBE toxin-antitoxin system
MKAIMQTKSIPVFRKELKHLAKKYPSLLRDVTTLLNDLQDNPFQGKPLGRNCFKIRLKIASKNTGKSGGGRIITNIVIEKDTLTLLAIYDKLEQDDISDAEIVRRLKGL